MADIDWRRKGFESRGLQYLLGAHAIGGTTAHRAMADVYGVLHLLAHKSGSRTYLAELLTMLSTITSRMGFSPGRLRKRASLG